MLIPENGSMQRVVPLHRPRAGFHDAGFPGADFPRC
jgi:hypothetical protein